MKEGDHLLGHFEMNTTTTLLLFTKMGNYLYLPVHQLPDIRWKDLGQHVANLVTGLHRDDEILKALPVKEFKEDLSLLFITKDGMAKRSQLSLYQAQRFTKPLMAIKLKEGDEVIDIMCTHGNNDLFLATKLGYGLWFSGEEVNLVGQRAAGVKAINLKEDDEVVSSTSFSTGEKVEFIIVTHRGAVKKVPLSEFEKSTRAKRGLVMLRELKSNPHRVVACIRVLKSNEELLLTSAKGKEVEIQTNTYRNSDRYSNGSFVLDNTVDGDVISVRRIEQSDSKS